MQLSEWDTCTCKHLKRDPEGGRRAAGFLLWHGWHHHFNGWACHPQQIGGLGCEA